LGDGGCTIYSETDSEAFSVPVHASIYKESAMARDAFCAALAAKLVDDHQDFSQQTAIWASTAMACAAEDFSLATPMPDRGRIERKLRVLNLR
jgi:ribokinase